MSPGCRNHDGASRFHGSSVDCSRIELPLNSLHDVRVPAASSLVINEGSIHHRTMWLRVQLPLVTSISGQARIGILERHDLVRS